MSMKRDPDKEWSAMGEVVSEFSLEELREFLEADLMDVPVDPEFKERLRERLWAQVRRRAPRSRH